MKKYLILLLLLFTGAIFQNQLFSYSGNIIGDTKCSEMNESTRYSNLSPTIIEKIDLIGDRINEKYELKDNVYKEKVYNLFEKVLNEHLQKTTYSGVQKEVLLRIGDYFVCKKENLNITQESLEIHNLQISNITDHGVKVTWEGNSKAQTWVYVKKTGTTGIKHEAVNNVYEYLQFASDHEFILYVQGQGSDVIKEVDFKTLSNNTASEEITSTNTEASTVTSENKYLEEVILPKCDVNNPEVQFIKTNDDWKHINDENKRIFCVSPGDYISLDHIKLTISGTKEKRRYIVLNNGNNIHPGKLSDNKRANFALYIKANYWTIDRMSTKNFGKDAVSIRNNSVHNIINRLYTSKVGYSVWIRGYAHNNTIQNGRFENGIDPGYDGPVAVQLYGFEKYTQIHNTKVINNEFYNQNDGFQIVRQSVKDYRTRYQDVNAEGTIVDSNKFYKDVPYMENAFDIKAGSDNPNNPVIISNNIAWGYRQHPDYIKGSYGPSRTALMVHMAPKNVYIINNIIFDSDESIRIGDNGALTDFYGSLIDGKIENNIFYNCGSINYSKTYATFIASSRNLKMNNNYYVDSKYHEGKIYGNYNGGSFNNNKVAIPYKNKITFDGYPGYSNTFQSGIDSTQEVSNNTWKDFIFTWGEFTNNPEQITLPKIMSPDTKFPKWH